MIKNELEIDSLADYMGSLKDFQKIIQELILEYGEHSLIYFDAGYNNVSVIIGTRDAEV